MYEKDGEKYFIFDSHLHFWDASPDKLGQGRRAVRKGLDRMLPRVPGTRSRRDAWSLEHFQKYSVEDFEKDVFIDGGVDKAVFQSTYLKEWYTNGFNDVEAQRGAAGALPRQADRQRPLGPA